MDNYISRATTDHRSNRFGDLLLDLCKSLNFRVVNGRVGKDANIGQCTCYTHNGESLVDFLITEICNFCNITNFYERDFTMYSNPAPVKFSNFVQIQYHGKIKYTSVSLINGTQSTKMNF